MRSYGDGLAQQSKQDGQDFANSAQSRVNDFNAHAANMDTRIEKAPAPLSLDEQDALAYRARNTAYGLLGKEKDAKNMGRILFGKDIFA